ncbi:S26 family signal peptidase [bacterium]|jgi:phage repressor protein C with HTH and peptisase S24 domain|nr:S26 family signal peptidase [bacterium]MBT4250824.1 S26 family signal peptidase [bacterium]MBT7037540.1 S26 family signal peptidase [bacterium]MBT7992726.1 S26 family signal peptidase [bacterium]
MQEGFSRGFYITMLVVSIVFVYIVFTVLPDTTKTVFVGEGSLMEPTLLDGDEVVVSTGKLPREGDIIVFKCKDKCVEFPGEIMTKRLDTINENGCYWVLGDNSDVSYDSRTFGELCPKDLELYGVVVDVKRKDK